MTAFESIVIGKVAIPSLVITVILMIAIPVIFFLIWRGKHKEQTSISWVFAGAAGFLISARVLELGVHYLCIVADHPVSRFINGNTVAFVLYGITMAGVFEECGRHIVLKYILKKNRTRENAVLYGIGHGGIEVLAVILPLIITYLAIAVLFSN
ncbi:MAG: YhfC family intramembrane metalloprotease, partial [Clostridia bacterium]|nr:YhfC family intramembrane metalloprotease [Clostridia bacterium]